MVVGAGRGPLVRKALEAAAQANRKIRVYAVEKNFGAVNTLNHMKQKEWMQDSVTIVKSDMREWNAPEKADIMISELIGSFGDNELSPECLDGAQRFLKSDGIMIPQSYTSYVSPIMSSKLWTEARNSPARSFQTQKYYTQLETPYVVHMRTRYEIDQPKKLFRFQHPKTGKMTSKMIFI
jgi:protein arginine N-methyltransferase 5